MDKSILTNYGGQGCIFNPSIPCKNEKKNKKTKKKNQISKIVFRDESANREIRMNNLVRKIPNNETWCVLWEKKCKTPSYKRLKKISEFDKCISQKNLKDLKKKKKSLSYKKEYTMLKGPFGGAISYYAFIDMCDEFTFKNRKFFIDFFLELFSYMESLFIGLVELQNYGICHQDINYRNILFDKKQCFYIDFGLTCKFSNNTEILKRLKIAFNNDRIYDSFPYDYTLFYSSTNNTPLKDLKQEIKDFENDYFRVHHEDYIGIQEGILKREDVNNTIYNHMLDISENNYHENSQTIIQNLDIYSLGFVLPQILYDLCISKNVPLKTLYKNCDSPKIKDHLELFRDMTSYHSRDRISAQSALERYRSIQSKNKYKSVFEEK